MSPTEGKIYFPLNGTIIVKLRQSIKILRLLGSSLEILNAKLGSEKQSQIHVMLDILKPFSLYTFQLNLLYHNVETIMSEHRKEPFHLQ